MCIYLYSDFYNIVVHTSIHMYIHKQDLSNTWWLKTSKMNHVQNVYAQIFTQFYSPQALKVSKCK